jgi:undecaprenyl-diphosphatase
VTVDTELTEDPHPRRTLWNPPLTRRDLGQFVLAFVLISAVFTCLGAVVTGPLDSSLGRWDRDVAQRMVASRTSLLDEVSHWGSMLSETGVKIAVTAVAVVVMVAIWKRWEDALLVATALILEASIFITVTSLVGRGRPNVLRLDSSPVDSAFPSGHVAAAVVYGAFAVIVARHSRRQWPVVLALTVVVAASGTVAWARMYRGMHFASDVIAGVLLGLVSLYVTWRILRGAQARERAPEVAQ